MAIAYASSGSTTTGGSWMTWIMIIVIFAALYFFTIRPQSKRDKELKNLRNSLKPGDEIITIGGIYGKIVRVTDDRVVIMVGADKTKLELAKSAISGLADPSAASSGGSSKAAAAEAEKESKPSPKSIRKLGAAKQTAEEKAEDAAAAAEKTAEAAAEVVSEAAEKTE
ncbi:MAG: preprotein translocase subunit YajC [Firmicutes bacterium]|nr:preprotein translocase subunit YajC [Bacillota bacterium]